MSGAGAGTVLAAADGASVVALAPGARLESLVVESGADVGVLGTGVGEPIVVNDVTVRASRGIALRIDGTAAELARVTLVGPVTPENAEDVPPSASAADWATHGLVITSSGTADAPVVLEDVSTTGFARFGALFIDSNVVWRGGNASRNLPVGLMAQGGTLGLDGVEIGETLAGVQPFVPAGAIFRDGIEVETTDVLVSSNDGYGVIQDGSTVSHGNLVANENSEPALWAQNGSRLELVGAASELRGNMLAGIVITGGSTASVRDALVEATHLATRIEAGGPVMVGDGIHVVLDSVSDVAIESVTLEGNERVGLLLDVGDGMPENATLTAITVDASGSAYGAVAQSGARVVGAGAWDTGVTRLGASVANDAAIMDPLETVGIVAPMFLPAF